ncbi:4-carboxy-4-hydroxy-2-oxoadipate aldolase/oxaloacetate decarboxylase [Streptomyces sp. NBC_00829]|uniref:4-carboxy-4-hydroxy-2-oxoadipate aldolase/oxaloacetate decarboxylase n=1 Tax=Streptomyces sp. NBC_00829 TaxID=2903679 RepID=UPI00386B383E|nr:4-carboxy-4-hydroxy-2-oxoadipate aldolase/oxaloacetate decarboxylase [Streptomyces sp. NBC_00829]
MPSRNVIFVGTARTPMDLVDRLASFGTATVHEAMGRSGYLGPRLRPIWAGARVAGNAVTVSVAPGDNLMAHAAVEQTTAGDILVVSPTSPCTDGYFGDVFATSLTQRGVRALVTDTGIRDVAELKELGFPAWSSAVSAQGTVKATPGSVNTPIVIGSVMIRPGDVIVADDDGVACVPRAQAQHVIDQCEIRLRKEVDIKRAFASGALGLDLYGLRELIDELGVEYSQAPPIPG